MAKEEPGWSTIRLTRETRDALAALGKKGQTYEDILKELLSGRKDG